MGRSWVFKSIGEESPDVVRRYRRLPLAFWIMDFATHRNSAPGGEDRLHRYAFIRAIAQKPRSFPCGHLKTVDRSPISAHEEAAVRDDQSVRAAGDGGGPKHFAGGRRESRHPIVSSGK